MVVLDIALFATEDATWEKGMAAYIAGANYHLANFDIRLNPFRAASPVIIPLKGRVHDRPNDFGPALLPGKVRAAAHNALPQPHGMPVIFCKFHRTGDAGITIYTEDLATNENVRWLNYVMINADVANQQRAVILHELIHAANYVGNIDLLFGRLIHDNDNYSIMRNTENADIPVTMMERHATALRNAYFARGI